MKGIRCDLVQDMGRSDLAKVLEELGTMGRDTHKPVYVWSHKAGFLHWIGLLMVCVGLWAQILIRVRVTGLRLSVYVHT